MTDSKGWLVAAPRSGAGKTTVTLSLIAAIRRRGIPVRTAKSGPDYIDPAFHAAASGRPGTNLDSWAMPGPLLDNLARGTDLLIVESAMGLFDGVPGPTGRTGAAADLAARFELPVLLVLDVSGQSQTAAAVAYGMATWRPGVRVGGVILNQVASPRHQAGVEAAMRAGPDAAAALPVLGAIPRDPAFALPARHLGLIQAREHPALACYLESLADMAERYLDINAILAAAGPLIDARGSCNHALPPPGQRIALAQDDAFSFIYPHLVAGWRGSGAEILPFSPLDDQAPPEGSDCCWLPGGYPELHAPRLAAANTFKKGLRQFAQTRPVHGECGGYMVMGTTLEDADGTIHPMTNLLGHATSFAQRKLNLGYREATLVAPCVLGSAATVLRGHEFHYAQCTDPGSDAPLALLRDGQGQPMGASGGRRGNATGTFFHVIARH